MRNIALLTGLFVLLLARTVHAASVSPTASASAAPTVQDKKLTQMDDLKERLATKVAELRQSQKKAIYGTVKSITVSTLTIETKTSDVKIELTDAIKVFQTLKGTRTELDIEDVDTGDTVVLFGDYDTSLDLMKTKVIVIQNPIPEKVYGKVSAVDTKEFTISVETAEKQTYVIDIEKYTVVSAFSSGGGIAKSGFSKIETGHSVFVSGTKNTKIDNRLSADRILNIGNMSGETPTPTEEPAPTASASASPTTTKKITPTPTVKK